MKRDSSWIVILILVAGLLSMKLGWFDAPVIKEDTVKQTPAGKQIDSLTRQNYALERQVNQLQLHSDSLRQRLVETRSKIVQLKKDQHEKSNRMDSLTGIELYGFFSEFNAQDSTGR